MTSTVISRCGLTLHDVSAQTSEKPISKLIRKYVSREHILKINLGHTFHRMGREVQRVYITLDNSDSTTELIKNRSNLKFNGELLKITRTLPKYYPLFNQCVTGLKIRIDQTNSEHSSAMKLNECDLKKYLQRFGLIRSCQWTNKEETTALFTFYDYDSVDQIILENTSPEIKGIKIYLEKTQTAEDCLVNTESYVIHVTNLPVCVTSEEISKAFQVPIGVILLYPCFRLELAFMSNGRTSSEAWITNFKDEISAKLLAKQKTGTSIRNNRIQCEAMSEEIYEDELCEGFQNGTCQYSAGSCFYKHISCEEPDTCDHRNCWYGHTDRRTTKSIARSQRRSEEARYRLKLNNIPAEISRETLIARLNLDENSAKYLIMQPTEDGSNSPKMAYLIRQPVLSKLQIQMDRWFNTSFISSPKQKLQFQLEIHQESFEWNDINYTKPGLINDRCASPMPSVRNALLNETKHTAWNSSSASTCSGKKDQRKNPPTSEQIQVQSSVIISQQNPVHNKRITTSLKSSLVSTNRQPPTDLSNLPTRWCWTNKMTPVDEMYLLESESNKLKYAFIKIYTPETDRTALKRAQCERIALEHLGKLACVPTLSNSNVDPSIKHSSSRELWNIMKFINGERLTDYINNNKMNLRQALELTQKLLNKIKEIHALNVVHRDIQPKNILIGQESNIMLINFSSAWIKNHQQIYSIKSSDAQLGNSFYRMPQFEIQEDEVEQQFQDSPSIDTTGICAILFWLITGHEPKESRNAEEKAPHELRNNPKIIQRKIDEGTGFQIETTIQKHLYRHLMFIFDRGFACPDQQWPVDDLQNQLEFIITLIGEEKEGINYFPPSPNTNDHLPLPCIPSGDSFVFIVSLIHQLKTHFATRYSNYIRWSSNEKSCWLNQNGRIENTDLLIFHYQAKNLAININWVARILSDQRFFLDIEANDGNKFNIELPLGVWGITEQTNDFQHHLKDFEMEMKILINILCR